MAKPKLIAGNWKMNGSKADIDTWAAHIFAGEAGATAKKLLPGVSDSENKAEILLCPPAILLDHTGKALKTTGVKWGGQDCHAEASGAHTGDISTGMLKEMGCTYAIVGHSERRQNHGETSENVANKARAVHAAGLVAIICVGETDDERTSGKAEDIVTGQLKNSIPDTATPENTVVAYEPVWAIGTGKVASAEDIAQMHGIIRDSVTKQVGDGVRLLYGGSVKVANAPEILHTPNVDGVLVGGASLKAEDFRAIAAACP